MRRGEEGKEGRGGVGTLTSTPGSQARPLLVSLASLGPLWSLWGKGQRHDEAEPESGLHQEEGDILQWGRGGPLHQSPAPLPADPGPAARLHWHLLQRPPTQSLAICVILIWTLQPSQ